jgi:GNAT superfamily N-acetyltransferase
MRPARLRVRQTTAADVPGIVALSTRIYGGDGAWTPALLQSHLEHFPEGQFVAVRHDGTTEQLLGMAASLIIRWDDYTLDGTWRDFTARGTFSNHDPVAGRTLYGAEVMADPDTRGQGVGTALYNARRRLVLRLGLLRIRAGARLRGYHRVATQMSAEAYAVEVVLRKRRDPTLSFQLARGFNLIGVVANYLRSDPESLGWAAVIEWLNEAVATEVDHEPQRAWRKRVGLET